jgi:hypothetical protein
MGGSGIGAKPVQRRRVVDQDAPPQVRIGRPVGELIEQRAVVRHRDLDYHVLPIGAPHERSGRAATSACASGATSAYGVAALPVMR